MKCTTTLRCPMRELTLLECGFTSLATTMGRRDIPIHVGGLQVMIVILVFIVNSELRRGLLVHVVSSGLI